MKKRSPIAVLLAHRWLSLILVAFILLAWAYSLVMPPFENLDEVEHFSAIRYVSKTGSLPVHDPVLQKQYYYRQEASQPPLYYILMSGVTRLLGLSSDDMDSYMVSNPFVACGPSDHPYNKHGLYHNPSREAFPWDGALLTLHVLRALTPFLQVFTIIGVYAIARLIFPQHPQVAPLAAALTAFNPQFLSVASGVNNDNLVTPLATLGVYLALLTRQRGLSWRRSVGLGLLAGLAGLSKLSGLLLLGFTGLILLEMLWRSRTTVHVSRFTFHALLIGAVAAALTSWWFWRNWQLYGDLTALEPMFEIVGRRGSPILPLNESGLMFRSFWGQIACSFFSARFYLFYSVLTGLGLAGLLWGFIRENRPNRIGMLFLAAWFGIIFVGWLRWDMLTPAPGGRLLFPAIASTSTLLAFGLARLCPTAWRGWVLKFVIVLLAVAALIALRWELRPFSAPPRTYAEHNPPAISHPLEATFGTDIVLAGYDAQIGKAPYLDVTLYWQALVPIPQDYALAIQLTSPIPGDDSLRLNYNTWPGRGNYPTTAWPLGRVIADHYRFELPASDAPTQAWQLLVALYETESGDRLPVRLDDQDVGRGLTLTTLRVPGLPPDCPEDAMLAEPVHFGQTIALKGATVRPNPESTNPGFQVTLCWESLAPTPIDYTAFVHLYDGSGLPDHRHGEPVATGDGPPMNGAFPTRLWQPGDELADLHFVPVTDTNSVMTGDYRIGVGLYDLTSGERLEAVQSGQPVLNNVVLLQP